MSLITGQWAEQQALKYLQHQNLQLIARNYHGPQGEIDLIMREQACVVFIEVRFRKFSNYGSGSETISYIKKQRIIKTAQYYLQKHHIHNSANCRFDVVELSKNQTEQIVWIRDAFQVQ